MSAWLLFASFSTVLLLVDYFKKHRFYSLVIAIVSVFFIFFSANYFSEYGLEGGHDPGVYFETAVSLAKNHSFIFQNDSSFLLAANPGITVSSGHFISIFPPVYPLYLSFFYSLFGLPGITLAVSLLEFFAVIMLLEVCSELELPEHFLILPSLLFLLNYYTLIFYRSTYVETFTSLIYLYIFYCLLKSLSISRYFYFGLIAAGLLTLCRSEGPINFFFYLLLLFPLRRKIFPAIAISLPIIFILFYYNLFQCNYFLNNLLGIVTSFINRQATVTNSLTIPKTYNNYLFNFFYIISSFAPVGYLLISITAIIGFLKLKWSNQKMILPIIFFFSLQFSYLVNSEIAYYLPWFIRRVYPSLIILIIILFSLVVYKKIFNHYLIILIMAAFVVFNLIPIFQIFYQKETGTLEFLEKLNQQSLSKDSLLVFVDRFGIENYAPTYHFIYQVPTYYDRIPFDSQNTYSCLAGKYLNREVYLISSSLIPDAGNKYFDSLLTTDNLVGSFKYQSQFFDGSCDVRNLIMNPYLFQGYQDISQTCQENNPPTTMNYENTTVYIYKIYFPPTITNQTCSFAQAQAAVNSEAQTEYNSYLNQ